MSSSDISFIERENWMALKMYCESKTPVTTVLQFIRENLWTQEG